MSDQTVLSRAEKRACCMCGYWDSLSHCSNCGTPLDFYGEARKTALGNLGMHLGAVLREFVLPVFGLFKTFWLLTVSPVAFFKALFNHERAIHDFKFPFTWLWRLVERGGFQYVFSPIRYYILSATVAMILMFGGGQYMENETAVLGFSADQAALVWSPIFTGLLAAAVAALLFERVLGKDQAHANHYFSLWVYMYGSMGVVISPFLFTVTFDLEIPGYFLIFLAGPLYFAFWVPYRVLRQVFGLGRFRLVWAIIVANSAAALTAGLSFVVVMYAVMIPLFFIVEGIKGMMGGG